MTEPPFDEAVDDLYDMLVEWVVLNMDEHAYYSRRDIMAVPYGDTTALVDNGIEITDQELAEAARMLYEEGVINHAVVDGKGVWYVVSDDA